MERTAPLARARVGLIHPLQERTQVVNQLTTEINTLYKELMREMGADPSAMSSFDPMIIAREHAKIEKSPLFPVWRDVFSPFLKEWNAFSGNYSEWSEALWLTNWDRFVSYVDRWHAIYEKVAKAIADKGGKLVAPPPQDVSQQTPSTQNPLGQSAVSWHGSPFCNSISRPRVRSPADQLNA